MRRNRFSEEQVIVILKECQVRWSWFVGQEGGRNFASRALALGEGLPMIGELLGHRKVQTTARYAHLARDSVRASTAKVAGGRGSPRAQPCDSLTVARFPPTRPLRSIGRRTAPDYVYCFRPDPLHCVSHCSTESKPKQPTI